MWRFTTERILGEHASLETQPTTHTPFLEGLFAGRVQNDLWLVQTPVGKWVDAMLRVDRVCVVDPPSRMADAHGPAGIPRGDAATMDELVNSMRPTAHSKGFCLVTVSWEDA